MARTKHISVLVFVIGWCSFLIYQGCSVKQQDEQPVSFESATYVGDQTCKSCHAEAYTKWEQSHHAKAMLHATDSSVLGDFNTTFVSKGITSAFYKEDDQFYVKTEGPDGTSSDFHVTFTFGWTPLQQYLVEFPDGKLQALYLAWDTEKNEWFDLYPDQEFPANDWMHWTNGAMTWNKMCAECHSTNLQKNYGAEDETYQTTWSQINVTCESCHGPGEAHLAALKSSDYQKGVTPSYMNLVVGEPAVTQVESCAPCHSRRSTLTSDSLHLGRLLDHYVPEVLRTELYYPDGQILEEDYVYGSFAQSKMFQNGVKCTDCHDPHTSKLKREGNKLCVECHTESFDDPSHTHHEIGTDGAACINCHMTGTVYMGNDFRRDHSFRIPRPDQSIAFGTPNACIGCHQDKPDAWAAEQIVDWHGPDRKFHYSDVLVHGTEPSNTEPLIQLAKNYAEPGIVRATAVHYLSEIPDENAYQTVVLLLNDRDPLVRRTAVTSLIRLPKENRIQFIAPLLQDAIRAVRVAAANALVDTKASELPIQYQDAFLHATKELEKQLAFNADFSSGQLQLAQVYDRQNETALAIKAYVKSLEMDSLLPVARVNLARLYSQQGKNEDAINILKQSQQINPENAQAVYSLALLFAEEGQLDEAVEYFEVAAELTPNDTRIYYNWGLLLNQSGKTEEGINVLRKGLAVDDFADDLRYAIVTINIQAGQPAEALKDVQILATRYPQNQEIQNLLRQLQVN